MAYPHGDTRTNIQQYTLDKSKDKLIKQLKMTYEKEKVELLEKWTKSNETFKQPVSNNKDKNELKSRDLKL